MSTLSSWPSPGRRSRHGLAIGLLLALAACGSGGGGGPTIDPGDGQGDATPSGFDFSMWTEREVSVQVRTAGGPVAGAQVQFADAVAADGTRSGYGVYALGVTDADGRLTRRLRIPSDRERVDLIVHEAGHVGPYTHESLRTEWGPTATSSRQSLVLDGLADQATLDVLLEVR